MQARFFYIVLTFFSFFTRTYAQDTIVHVDTLTIEKYGIYHRSIFTGKTWDMYDWKKQEGHNIIYKPTGAKYLDCYYKRINDTTLICHGNFIFFNNNASIRSEGMYVDDEKYGLWTFNDSLGNISHSIIYPSNYYTYFYSTGKKESEGYIIKTETNSFRLKHWIFYYPNGNPKCSGELALLGKVGRWSFYDENGMLVKKVHYSHQRLRHYKFTNTRSDFSDVCDCKK